MDGLLDAAPYGKLYYAVAARISFTRSREFQLYQKSGIPALPEVRAAGLP